MIGFDRVVEAVLLDETFRAIQLLDNIHAHAGSDNFLDEAASTDTTTGSVFRLKKHYILSRLRAPNRSGAAAQNGNSLRGASRTDRSRGASRTAS